VGIYYILQIKEAHKRPYWRETISGKLQCDGGGGGGGGGLRVQGEGAWENGAQRVLPFFSCPCLAAPISFYSSYFKILPKIKKKSLFPHFLHLSILVPIPFSLKGT